LDQKDTAQVMVAMAKLLQSVEVVRAGVRQFWVYFQ
jgi:hypothetical protein